MKILLTRSHRPRWERILYFHQAQSAFPRRSVGTMEIKKPCKILLKPVDKHENFTSINRGHGLYHGLQCKLNWE